MAQSFDGDIRLSVGVDTTSVQDSIKKFGKSAAKAFADGNVSVKEMNNAASNLDSTLDKTSSSVKNLDKSIEKTSKDINKMDATKAAGNTEMAFERAGKSIGKAMARITDSFKTASNSTKGQESGLVNIFANAGKAIDSAYLKIARFFRVGDNNTLEQSMERTVDEAKKLGSTMGETASKVTSSNSRMSKAELQHENRLIKLRERIEMLERKQAEFAQMQIPTEQYKELDKEIIATEKDMGKLRGKMADMKDAGKVVPVEMEEKLERLKEDYRELIAAQQKLENSGKAFTSGLDTEAGIRNTQALEAARREMEILNAEQVKTGKTAKKTSSNITHYFSKAFAKIRSLGSKMWGGIKGIFNKMKDKAKSSANDMDKSFKRGFRNILKYALGIRSFYLLFRKIRSAAKEALKAMATQFPEINAQLSSLKNSFIQLKGSIGTVVQPLVTLLAPALEMIINLATAAANAVASFVAIITGQQYIYKAKKGTTSFADAQDASTDATKKNTKALEENQKQLGFYDKLNIIDQDKSKSGAGGGGAGGASGSDMTFEKVPVDSQIGDFVKRIKSAWKKADFTDIGKMIGEKLKHALDNIPWKSIQTKAEKVGKSLGTLLAGFVSVPGLAKSIGNAIGNAINTVLIGIRTFVKNVPWYRFGKFLADGLSSALLAKDKNGTTLIGNIAKTFIAIVNGAIDAFGGFVKNVKWKKIGQEIAKWIKWAIKNIKFEQFMEACGRLVNGIVDLIYEIVSDKQMWKDLGTKIAEGINKFFHTVDWTKFGKTISDGIIGILDAIIAALDTLDWEQVGRAIGDFLGNIDWWGIFTRTLKVIGKAFWGILTALFTPSKSTQGNIIKTIIAGLGLIFVASKFGGLISKITTCFSGVLSKGLVSGAEGATGAGTTSKIATKISGVLGKVASNATVVLAAGAVGFAIGGWIASKINEKMDAWYDEVAEKSKAAAEEVRQEFEQARREIVMAQKAAKDAKEIIDDVNNRYSKIDNSKLMKSFEKLAKKTHLTKQETQKYKEICEKMVKKYPELKKYFDKTTGLFDTHKASVEGVRTQYELLEKAAYNSGKKSELETKLEKINTNAKNVRESIKKAREDMQNYQIKADAAQQLADIYEAQSPLMYWSNPDWQKAIELRDTNRAKQQEASNQFRDLSLELQGIESDADKAREAIEKMSNVEANSKIKPEQWDKVFGKMRKSIDKLELKESDKKKIFGVLQRAVEDGTLTFEQYQSIADKSYKSTDALKKEIQKIAGKKVSTTINMQISNLEKWNKLKQEWKQYNKGVAAHVKVMMEYHSDIKDPVMRKIVSQGSVSDLIQYLRYGSTNSNGRATGGIYTGSGWHPVEGYASGGSPKSGQFFMARENGIPELVGTIRNHTAVMNNSQIVASVANGVYRAVAGVASAILPYVRSQTHAMNWLAQNGLQVPELSKVASGNVLPASNQFISVMGANKSDSQSLDSVVEAISQLNHPETSKEPIIIQMPNGKVLAEVVWEEEEKKYKQVRSSTLRPKFA